MKKFKCECRGSCEPKNTWFILPIFMIDRNWGRLSFCFGWLFLGFMIEISRGDE